MVRMGRHAPTAARLAVASGAIGAAARDPAGGARGGAPPPAAPAPLARGLGAHRRRRHAHRVGVVRLMHTTIEHERNGGEGPVRKLIVSIHATANGIVTGPPSDETNCRVWAQPGIEDSLESFAKSLAGVDCILLGRGTYEDLVRKWPTVSEWPDVSAAALGIGEKINRTPKVVVTATLPPERLAWGALA